MTRAPDDVATAWLELADQSMPDDLAFSEQLEQDRELAPPDMAQCDVLASELPTS